MTMTVGTLITIGFFYFVGLVMGALASSELHFNRTDTQHFGAGLLWPFYLVRGIFRWVRDSVREFRES